MATKHAQVNPEIWSAKELQNWLHRFENGRFVKLQTQLTKYSGRDVVHFTQTQWRALTPSHLATSLRFTLLGMVHVANTIESPNNGQITIVTDFFPMGDQASLVKVTGGALPNGGKKLDDEKAERIEPVEFPPMLAIPTPPVLLFVAVIVLAFVLSVTVLKDGLARHGVTTEDIIKYGSIPFVSVGFTYVHIWLALLLTFYPIKFMGIYQIPGTNTGLGWQGIVPFKAEKMARQATQLMTTQLLRVKDVFSRIDPARVVEELEPALNKIIAEIVEDMAMKYQPDLWAAIPQKIKDEIVEKVKEESPSHIMGLMDEIRNNIEDVFDIESMVVANMTKDKQLLVNIFVTCGYQELAFIRNSGAWMGFIFGLMQMGLWFFYQDPIVVFPVIGLVVGTITNWLALKMIFEPVNPKKVGCFTLHGLFLRRQAQVAEVYGQLVSTQVLTTRGMFEGILKGPYSDRLFELVYDNVQKAVTEATATTESLINMGLGANTYASIRQDVTNHIVRIFPQSLREIEDYATNAMQLESTLTEKMKEMSSEQFEQLLHPIFEEDEWKLVLMGGVLGFAIGLFQAFVLE